MVMIKDNHVESAGSVSEAIRRAQSSPITADLPIVVEVATMAQLEEALQFRVDRILLDNMSDQQMRRAVERTAGRVPLEASGNMTLRRVPAVAATGVDYISVGAITHSAPALDLSMQIEPL
jgi:nicotinate-nucleotide pyrophosphorylase (carboxylating)